MNTPGTPKPSFRQRHGLWIVAGGAAVIALILVTQYW